MASAARAWDTQADARTRESYAPRRDFVAVPGTGKRVQGISPAASLAFRLVLTAVIALTAVAICRVFFTASTTAELMSTKDLTSQLAQARSDGDDLEVEQALLADPSRVRQLATENLGMVPASGISYMDITDGVLATDNLGDCSLSGSLAVVDASAASSSSDGSSAAGASE